MLTMLKTGVLHRTDTRDLQSYIKFMIRIEVSSWRELAEAELIDKNAKPYYLPTEEMERLYLSNGGFKPSAPFQSCAKCRHNLIDEPAKNKSFVRDNKRVQLPVGEDFHYGGKFSSGQVSVPQGQKGQSYNEGP